MRRSIPLLPVHSVLFPGVALSLRITENRERLLIRRCLEDDRRFGAVLRRSGPRSGSPPALHPIGTIARVLRFETRGDGSLILSTLGERRFRIQEIAQEQPYLVGAVELLADEASDVSEQLVVEVRREFIRYVQALRRLSQRSESRVAVPDTPLELSYVVATNLQIERAEQQALLEEPPLRRLRREREVLRRELAMLERLGAITARRILTPGELALN